MGKQLSRWEAVALTSGTTPSEFDRINRTTQSSTRARFRQIADSLKQAIISGVYRPGDHLPTEMELAREHHVSRVTAAAALTELARAGLVTRAPRRGTIVQAGAQFGRTTSRPIVAWIVRRVESTFNLGILQGIQKQAREAGFGLVLCQSGESHEEEAAAIREAVADGAFGIMIFIQDGESYNADVLRLVLGSYPVVLVDRYLRGVRCAVVSSDNEGGSKALVQELLEAGHRHICVLTFPPGHTSVIEDRVRGYVRALTDAGVPVDYSLHYIISTSAEVEPIWVPGDDVIEPFVAFLEDRPDVTAIFATNAFLGLIAYRAIERLGLRIPENISLVCVDPLEAIPLELPAVTCGVQQGEAIGRTAVTLLQEVMSGKPPRIVLLPMLLRKNGSVGQPAPRTPRHDLRPGDRQ
jgi:GntR family transcriptional regulator of arabinose operon